MKQIRIVDEDGKPIRYAYLEHENLKFEFEFYAHEEGEGDYEIIQTVKPAEFEFIATMFGLNPMQDILSIVQEISDSGRGCGYSYHSDNQSVVIWCRISNGN